MSIWEILGIEATGDTSIIRKAYARKLRIHHPEEDPEGYQRLREAYDSAMKQAPYFEPEEEDEASWSDEGISENFHEAIPKDPMESHVEAAAQDGVTDSREDLVPDPKRSVNSAVPAEFLEQAYNQQEPRDPIHGFIDQLEELYENFSLRMDSSAWEQLLNQDIVWDVQHSEQLQYALITYLEDHHHLPRAVWQQLDGMFHFQENRDDLLDQYPESFVDYMIGQILGTTELRYDCFKLNLDEDIDIEHYLELREQAQYMLMFNEPEEAGEYLSEANEMFPHDPDLQLMRGKYNLAIGDADAARECFSQAILLQPEDLDGYWHRAQILFEQQDYQSALTDLGHTLDKEPQNTDALSLKGRCYMELGDMDQARETLKQSNQLENLHIHSFVYLCMAANKYAHGQIHIDPADIKRARRSNVLFDVMMVLRLSWLYILVYLVLQLFFDVHPLFTGLLGAVLLWNTWKAIRVHRTLGT